MNGLPRPLGGATKAGSKGRLIPCSACQPQNYKRRNHIPVSHGLQAAKATRVPTHRTRANRGGGVLLQRPPRVEGREDIQCYCEAPICPCLALKEHSSWEEGDLHRKELSYHKGGPQKVLVTAAALKGEMERPSCPLPQSWSEVRARSKSKDC